MEISGVCELRQPESGSSDECTLTENELLVGSFSRTITFDVPINVAATHRAHFGPNDQDAKPAMYLYYICPKVIPAKSSIQQISIGFKQSNNQLNVLNPLNIPTVLSSLTKN